MNGSNITEKASVLFAVITDNKSIRNHNSFN